MLVTEITKQKRGARFNVYLDGVFAFGVDYATLLEFDLRKDLELTSLEIDEIKQYEIKTVLKNKALNLLAKKAYTAKGLTRKLIEKGFDEASIFLLLQDFVSKRLIDEGAYATDFVRAKLTINRWGRRKIELGMKAKGFEPGVIENALNNIDLDSETEAAKQLINKRYPDYMSVSTIRNKAYKYLLSRGFANQTISEILTSG